MWQLGFFLKFSVSDYLLVCRFVPVLVLPRYSVATGSISPRSQHGRTVLWNPHVKTKIKTFPGFLWTWTICSVVSLCLSTLGKHCLPRKLLPGGITSSLWHWAFALLNYSQRGEETGEFFEKKWHFREAKHNKEWFQERKTSFQLQRCYLITPKGCMSGKQWEYGGDMTWKFIMCNLRRLCLFSDSL